MKKPWRSVVIIFLPVLAGILQLSAQPVSSGSAGEIAKTVYQQRISRSDTGVRDLEISERFIKILNTDTVYYVFNFSGKNGYVILSADERAYPLLAYSRETSYSETDQPPSLPGPAKELLLNISPNIQELHFFKVYPNPTTGLFRTEFTDKNSSCNAEVIIYNMFGKEVLRDRITSTMSKEFSLVTMPVGV